MLQRVSYTAREFSGICSIGNALYPIDQFHDVEDRGDSDRFVGHAVARYRQCKPLRGVCSDPSHAAFV